MRHFITITSIVAAFVLTAGKPATKTQKLKAIKAHKEAIHIKEDGWIRDPYIILGPDDNYYLTGTTPPPIDPKERSDRYNAGLGDTTIVGDAVQVWKSSNLIDWEYLGAPYSLDDASEYATSKNKRPKRLLWAPELHWTGDKWALVHCPQNISGLALSEGLELKAPWVHPAPEDFYQRHDPSLFKDGNNKWYLLYGNTFIAPIKEDFKGLAAEPIRIDPADRVIGHEGATMKKIGGKYVHFGTAWSTDKGRKGSYNLYYCTSDNITGPYSERRFAGRFLGHGTPFQDRDGKWWCTAFYNANVPPLDSKGIESRDLSETAQTINPQGTTIVPLDVRVLEDGDIYIRAIDPRYATPGPDEVQEFD